jgi:hypothetical protein
MNAVLHSFLVISAWKAILCDECVSYKCVKGKAIPLQALTEPEGSRRLRLPDFKTVGT